MLMQVLVWVASYSVLFFHWPSWCPTARIPHTADNWPKSTR